MVSVVIPNLHSPIIDQVVAAMQQQTAQDAICEILVIGQGQPCHLAPNVSYIPSQRPLSAASARNLGARLASGTYLLFIDADCIAAPDLVEHLLARHAQGYAVVGGSVMLEPTNYWLLSDNILTFAPTVSTAAPGPRRYLPSLNFSIARTVFYAHNGFDEQFIGAAGEDIALSVRLRQRGYDLFFEPRARIIHRPQRVSARHLAAHLRAFGRVHVSLQRRYGVQVSPRLTTRMRFLSGAIAALSPMLATYDIVRLFKDNPHLWRYAYTMPGMVWGKMAWYGGVVESLLAVPPQTPIPTPPPVPAGSRYGHEQTHRLPNRPDWHPHIARTSTQPPRVLVIGLDSASPELVFGRWQQDLPTIKWLMQQGISARLKSSLPATSVPAWSCMTTGCDPGQLGIYGLQNRIDYTYGVLPIVTSRAVQLPQLWNMLAHSGERVGVIGVPPTYPVVPVQGELCSCFLAPDARSTFAFPPAFQKDVRGWFHDEFRLDVPHVHADDKVRVLQDIYRMSEQHFEVCQRLLARQRYGFFMVIDRGTAQIQRAFANTMDRKQASDLLAPPFDHAMHNYYQFLDCQIANLLTFIDDDTIVIVVSAHGAQTDINGSWLNAWLIQRRYLVMHNATRPSNRLDYEQVDWAHTRAWSSDDSSGQVFLNVQGREPQGCVPPNAYEALRDELTHQISASLDSHGHPTGVQVFKPDTLYHRLTNVPPDLLLAPGERDGFFVLAHPRHAGSGYQPDALSIYDIAPTLLHLVGHPVPAEMRGTTCIFW